MTQRTPANETTLDQPEPPVGKREQSMEWSTPISSDKTPPEFYAEMMRRSDVRAILEALAKG